MWEPGAWTVCTTAKCRAAAGELGASLMQSYGANLLFFAPVLVTLKVRLRCSSALQCWFPTPGVAKVNMSCCQTQVH